MNPETLETLEALKGSIEKWRKIVEEGARDYGGEDCPLCDLFCDDANCVGCPVSAAAGEIYCKGTPYMEWHRVSGRYAIADTPEKIAAARAELDFLRSLLPKEEASE